MKVVIDGVVWVPEKEVVQVVRCSQCENISDLQDELSQTIRENDIDIEDSIDASFTVNQIELEGFKRGLVYSKGMLGHYLKLEVN